MKSATAVSNTAVVAEKPSVARDIAKVLGATQRGEGFLHGNGYVVTWAIGHLVGLAQPHEIRPEWKQWRRDQVTALVRKITRQMAALNRRASEAASEFGARALTDVTGFGLMGHGSQMADASRVTLRLRPQRRASLSKPR